MALTHKKLREIERKVDEAWAEIDKQAHASLPQPGERTIEQLAQEWGCGVTKARAMVRDMVTAGQVVRRDCGRYGKAFFAPAVQKGRK